MSQLITYLIFNGNCKEAMSFYRDCLGGELTLQALADSPGSEGLPVSMKRYIVQASLKRENMVLMGTDLCDEEIFRGNSISILIEGENLRELESYYDKLAENGHASFPLAETFWGGISGGLIDKFGNRWLFRIRRNGGIFV